MPDDTIEDWEKLSELAAKEEDPVKLSQLIDRLCKILDQKQKDPTRFGTKNGIK